MLNLKDENKEVISNHDSFQIFNLEKPKLMLKLKEENKEVASSHHSI